MSYLEASVGGSPRYDAFISYSHAQDKPLAAKLQAAIQRLGKPWYRRRALRLFRDDTSLNATPHLWPSIVTALGQSRFLILMASPEAAASPWVAQEVEWWLDHSGPNALLIALTDGELTWDGTAGDFNRAEPSPLPSALKGRFADEPRWIDLRRYRAELAPKDDAFLGLAADFASTIRGIPKEDLLSQEVRQHRRALRLAGAAVGIFFVLLCLAAWQWWTAEVQRARADRTINAATATVNQLIIDIARQFRIGGQFSAVKDIIDKLNTLQAALLETGGATPELEFGRATALNELYTSFVNDGDPAGALAAVNKARDIFQSLLKSAPNNIEYSKGLIFSNDAAAQLLFGRGKISVALADFQASAEIVDKLKQQNPKDAELAGMASMLQGQMAIILQQQGHNDDALEALNNSTDFNDPNDYTTIPKIKMYGDILRAKGDFDGALDKYQEALSLDERFLDDQPANMLLHNFPMLINEAKGETLIARGKLSQALDVFTRMRSDAKKSPISDDSNLFFAEQIVAIDENIGEIMNAESNSDGSLTALNEAISYVNILIKHNPDSVFALNYRSEVLKRIADAQSAKGDHQEAIDAYKESLQIRRSLLQIDDSNVNWQIELASTLQGLASLGKDRDTHLHEALKILQTLKGNGTIPREEEHRIRDIEGALSSTG